MHKVISGLIPVERRKGIRIGQREKLSCYATLEGD